MLKNIWDFLNKPLIVTIIVFISSILLYTTFVEKEIVNCTYAITLNKEIIINEYGVGEEGFNELNKELGERNYNFLFDSFEEAYAYRQILRDLEQDYNFVKFQMTCYSDKVGLPSDFKLALVNSLPLR